MTEGSHATGVGGFVEYGARAEAPPPFPSLGGRLRGFVLKGQRARVEALCARMFTLASFGALEYRPISAYVLLLVGSFRATRSDADGLARLGSVPETQASLWIPMEAVRRQGTRFVKQRLCMAVPYIWVDNPLSLTTGREVYGYPKSLGRFTPSDGLAEHVTLETFGGDFGPQSVAGWHTILEVQRGRRLAADARHEPWRGVENRLLKRPTRWRLRTRDTRLLYAMVDELLHRRVQQLFLKQFRSAEGGTAACYQAVVEAPITVTRASWRPSLREWTVVIHKLDSHPLTDELGLETQTTRRTYELRMDMVVGPGTVIATAALPRHVAASDGRTSDPIKAARRIMRL
jgi:hypothetical protein